MQSADRHLNNWGMFAVVIVLVVFAIGPGLYYGVDRHYLEYSDADVMFPYWAILVNDGFRQDWYDHPGAFYIIFLGIWYRILKFFGFLDVAFFRDLPGPESFEPHFVDLVISGRIFGLLIASAFICVFFFGLLSLTRKTSISIIFTLLLGVSPGFSQHLHQLRTELMSATFVCLSTMFMYSAVRRLESSSFGVKLALSSASAVIAIETKVTAIVPLLLVIFCLPVFSQSMTNCPGRQSSSQWRKLLYLLALIMALPVISEFYLQWQGFRFYFILVLIALASAFLGHFRYLGRHPVVFFDTLSWIIVGVGAGYLLNFIAYDTNNIKASIYFLDHLQKFGPMPGQAHESYLSLGVEWLNRIWSVFSSAFTVDFSDADIFGLAYWGIAIMIFFAVLVKNYRIALQTTVLLGISLITTLVFTIRANPLYEIYYHFWVIIGLGIGCAHMLDYFGPYQRKHLLPVWSTVLAVIILIQAENYLHKTPTQKLTNVCGQSYAYLHRIRHYFDRYCPESILSKIKY